ncbi:MAG: bifunctional lysylphosphatidylglycerol flippase/synthetase MprF [Deltaproteobacteria bacterium]|jgi:phosphatidylglycerol lysyltransferase
MMKKNLHRYLGPLISVILFTAAVWLLRNELKTHHLKDIVHTLEAIPVWRLMTALALSILGYLVMTSYDVLALHYVGQPLAYKKIGLASFIGYAFSNNIGFSMIAGASVRYRLYSAWGLSTLQVTLVVVFCTVTLWLGFFTLGGLVFILEPLVLPPSIHLPFASVRLIGLLMLAVVFIYILVTIIKKKPLKVRGYELKLPSIRLLFPQLTIAAMDWAIAGGVLYILLAPVKGLSYFGFLRFYLLAQLVGLVSQVPGGLGVFETLIVLLLSSRLPVSNILAALLVYRLFYYWLPLGVATILFGLQEILRRKKRAFRFAGLFDRWVSPVLPQVLAFAAFVAGAILMFSGAVPALDQRLAWLQQFLPLPFLELSHFIGSLAGMGLLLLARSLQQRLDAAYVLTIVLLGIGIIASLLKGFDYEEALVLGLILVVMLPSHRYFYRKSSLFSRGFNAGWVAAILIVLICTAWLGFYAYRHVEYADSLWWRFTFAGDASRFLRAMVGAVALGLFFGLSYLLRASPPRPRKPQQKELENIYAIVNESPRTSSNLALLGDKFFLLNTEGNAFIMYGIEGRSWTAMGDPVGPRSEWMELIWTFRELSDRYGGRTVFYQVGHENLHYYLDLGLNVLKLGEEARVPLTDFSLEGSERKGLRYTQRKLEKEGYQYEVLSPQAVSNRLSELKEISDAWLAEKNTREKGFSLGFFNPDYLKRFPAAVVVNKGQTVAFANIWLGGEKEELSIDLMRFRPDAPRSVMEYLFIQIMLWGKQQGYNWFNLGMAPLAGLEDRALAPLWNRLGAFVFQHGENFYNFQGLRQYKEKFIPEWRPKYLASPGGLALAQILANLATLISGGVKGIFMR